MKNPSNPKERNLIKGALRRVFSRSELRLQALNKHNIAHYDENRPRVTKWSWCGECGVVEPRYLMQVDHKNPVIGVHETMDDLTWDELIEERMWCTSENLVPLCKSCHKIKTKEENKARREFKKRSKV